MKYKSFHIQNYRGISDATVRLDRPLIPLVGLNESGKSTVLQALTHFDHRNDPETAGWQTRNRYKASETSARITAVIEIGEDDLRRLLAGHPEETADAAAGVLDTPFPGVSSLRITRQFARDGSRSYRVADLEPGTAETIANAVIEALPWLRHVPDILKHELPATVAFPAQVPQDGELTVPQLIIKEIFAQSGVISIEDYAAEQDRDIRASRLGAVSARFNAAVIKAWQEMHAEIESLNGASRSEIEAVISDPGSNGSFELRVHETVGSSAPVVMKVEDRSTGFRWYFNFAVLKSYGLGNRNDSVVYLIDEPGSFLHSKAQKTLIDTLADLARTTPVVFTTHSEFLLNPEVVNPNDIMVVEKKSMEVSVSPLSECEMSLEHGPMTPVYRALGASVPLTSTIGQRVVVTEGLTDFQFWKMSGRLDGIVYLPGVGAGSNKYLISLAIGSSDAYVALFDGDPAGNRAINGYKKMYADEEARNWVQYEKSDGSMCQLESILSSADQEALMAATQTGSPKKALTKLFYMPQPEKDQFWHALDAESRANLDHMERKIKSVLKI